MDTNPDIVLFQYHIGLNIQYNIMGKLQTIHPITALTIEKWKRIFIRIRFNDAKMPEGDGPGCRI